MLGKSIARSGDGKRSNFLWKSRSFICMAYQSENRSPEVEKHLRSAAFINTSAGCAKSAWLSECGKHVEDFWRMP
jgi:hypothetical protein